MTVPPAPRVCRGIAEFRAALALSPGLMEAQVGVGMAKLSAGDTDAARSELSLYYDDDLAGPGTSLRGVDNITMSSSKDLYVAEDGDDMEICVITAQGVVAPFLRVEGHAGSELTGVAFNPAGNRLYFSSQRGTDGAGITFEVRGPFRT